MRMVTFLYDRLWGGTARPRLVELRDPGGLTLLVRTLLVRTRLAWTCLSGTLVTCTPLTWWAILT